VSLHENALRNAGVLNSGFDNMNGIIIQVVINNALPHPEVFVGIFNDGFLEERSEA
jgi:hypothetical protein